MRILRIDPVAKDSDGMKLLAYFDVELTEDIRLYGVKLLEAPSSRRIVCAPQAGARRTATFSPSLAEALTNLVSQHLEAATANDANSERAA